MRPKDTIRGQELEARLRAFDAERHPLPGVCDQASRDSLVEQIIESIRRIEFVSEMRQQTLSECRADPKSASFDPLKAAILRQQQGQIDEAFWLVFLSVHFGKHLRTGWRLCRDVYGSLGDSTPWDWNRTSRDPAGFSQWLARHENRLRGADGIQRIFGNHRKYESLNATSPRGTGAVISSYIRWIAPPRTHEEFVRELQQLGDGPEMLFERIYKSMKVISFGRTAKFDYLTMIGKLELAPIKPGSPYLNGATGPLRGARLLFGGRVTAHLGHQDLDAQLIQLGADLDVGMQVIEDALCNWQKCPKRFVRFRG